MKHNYIHFIKFVYRASPLAASGHLLYFLSLLFFTFSIFSFRSSYRKCSIKKAVLIILNILRKTPLLEPLFNKVHACNFIKKRLQHRCFPEKYIIINCFKTRTKMRTPFCSYCYLLRVNVKKILKKHYL